MLEKLPSTIGRRLRRVRSGLERILAYRKARGTPTIELESPAFHSHHDMPALYTADGEGISPPLEWGGVPDGTRSLVLVVEDADSPTPSPLVHAIVAHLPPVLRTLEEGAITPGDHSPLLGKNSYFKAGWLPPDPPPGHGAHRYAFQLFALDDDPELGHYPGRTALMRAMEGHILGYGLLVGTYQR
jgi:Raf kinase inhibitor-like YbhB/YbcL family protein